MLHQFLTTTICQALPFPPTTEQAACIDSLAQFCTSPEPMHLFLLQGYAGTGKTSVVSALVSAMRQLEQPTILLAPTGRAAKVFASYASQTATSIHKQIYRQKSVTEFSFSLNYNKNKQTLFIVDEASMIGNSSSDGGIFGSGRLLDDLITYVYSGDNCRLILLGDSAQLLPVMQDHSPALDKRHLEGYGLTVNTFQLTQVVRQAAQSGILYNATLLRDQLGAITIPSLKLGFEDIHRISGAELIDTLNYSYNTVGQENTIIITRSNKRANLYNNGIRNQVLQKEEQLSTGDLLLVTKNNYFWSRSYENLDFIANGDIAEVVRIRRYEQMHNLTFADVILCLTDYDMEVECRLLVDTLTCDTSIQIDHLNNTLQNSVSEDYIDIKNKRERYVKMREDMYLNALQVKFAYAITCHKAQGGQWEHVYIDSGIFKEDQFTPEYAQWLYTAFTRAQKQLYLVNFLPNFF